MCSAKCGGALGRCTTDGWLEGLDRAVCADIHGASGVDEVDEVLEGLYVDVEYPPKADMDLKETEERRRMHDKSNVTPRMNRMSRSARLSLGMC